MAYYDITRPAAHGRLRRAIGDIFRDLVAWREGVETRHVLGRLTDRELYDIGLSRGELELNQHDELRNS